MFSLLQPREIPACEGHRRAVVVEQRLQVLDVCPVDELAAASARQVDAAPPAVPGMFQTEGNEFFRVLRADDRLVGPRFPGTEVWIRRVSILLLLCSIRVLPHHCAPGH